MVPRIKVTYIAMDCDGLRQIMTADSMENLRAGLDDYYGVHDTNAECLGFEPYYSKYPSEFEGTIKYKYSMVHSGRDLEATEYIDELRIYCIDFWPHTSYEI